MKLINERIGRPDINANLKEFKNELDRLERKKATKHYKEKKDRVLENAKTLYGGIKIIADAVKNTYFPPKYNPNFSLYEEESNEESNDESGLVNFTERKKEGINIDLFKKHFTFRNPTDMLKALAKTKSQKDNKELVNMTKSGLEDLDKEI